MLWFIKWILKFYDLKVISVADLEILTQEPKEVIKEIIREKEVIKEVEKDPDEWTLEKALDYADKNKVAIHLEPKMQYGKVLLKNNKVQYNFGFKVRELNFGYWNDDKVELSYVKNYIKNKIKAYVEATSSA